MKKNYEVYVFSPDNPQHLSQWLEQKLLEDSLHLITSNGNWWIFEQVLELDTSATIENNWHGDALVSYGEFYDKAVIALGFSSASLPSSDTDEKMLERISDLFWLVNILSKSLEHVYKLLPSHWRDTLPFSYFDLMNEVKTMIGGHSPQPPESEG